MHSSSFNQEPSSIQNESEVFVAIATLVTEGRIPGPSECASGKSRGFHEGPHCTLIKRLGQNHRCTTKKSLCEKFKRNRDIILKLHRTGIPICIEVLFTCACKEINNNETDNLDNAVLLEQWYFCVNPKRVTSVIYFNINQLVSAIRSQLYFSQITAWLVTQGKSCCEITSDNLRYRLSSPEELLAPLKFSLTASKHEFPLADIGGGKILTISFLRTPRTSSIPTFNCVNCSSKILEPNLLDTKMELQNGLLDDRMHTSCTLKGKHCCEDNEDNDNPKSGANMCGNKETFQIFKKDNMETIETVELPIPTNPNKIKSKLNNEIPDFCLDYDCEYGSPTFEEDLEEAKFDLERHNMWPHDRCHNLNDLKTVQDKGQLLLDAIERSGQKKFKQ